MLDEAVCLSITLSAEMNTLIYSHTLGGCVLGDGVVLQGGVSVSTFPARSR